MCVTGPTVAVIRKVDDVTQKMQNRDMLLCDNDTFVQFCIICVTSSAFLMTATLERVQGLDPARVLCEI